MGDLPVVEVKDLIVKYGEKTVLSDINASIMRSEIRVILGSSGCGKTTLLKAIIGLLQPYSGEVRIFGKEVEELDSPKTSDILRHIGVLFQNGALLGSLTVRENVALPLQMHTDLPDSVINEIVCLKLSQVELLHALDLYPGELSGGMRKRAAMARALALDPPLLFCDEPSAGLDPVTSSGLDDLLLKIRDILGITIVVITHELLSIEKISDNIIFLYKGKKLFDGSLKEALSIQNGEVYNFFNRSGPEGKY